MKKHIRKTKGSDIKKRDTFIEVDSQSWRQPEYLSIEELEKTLDSSANIRSVSFNGKYLPPDANHLTGLEVATDENFLYVWVKTHWKRIPLSEF